MEIVEEVFRHGIASSAEKDPPSMMLSSSSIAACLLASLGDKGLFSSANILQIADVARWVVFLLFLLSFWPMFAYLFLVKRMKCFRHFVFTTKKLYLAPSYSRFTVNNLAILLHDWRNQSTYRKILTSSLDNSWLWWVMRGILANQKWRNTLDE